MMKASFFKLYFKKFPLPSTESCHIYLGWLKAKTMLVDLNREETTLIKYHYQGDVSDGFRHSKKVDKIRSNIRNKKN